MAMKANKKKGSFFNDFLTLGTGNLLYLVVGVIGTPVITRLIDPADYGRMSLLTVYSGIGVLVCGVGLDQTLVRYFYKEDSINYKRKLLRFCALVPIAFAVILSILLTIFSFLSQRFGFESLSLTETVILEANIFVQLLMRYSMLIHRLKYHTKMYSTVNVISKLSYIILTVALVLLFRREHFLILAVSTVTSAFLAVTVSIFYERDLWKKPQSGYKLPFRYSELFRYGWPLMLSSGISMIFKALDKLFINHFGTLEDVGVYAGAMNLVAIFAVINTSFNALWMPSVVDHYEKNPEDKKFYQQGNAFISVLMLSFGAAVVLFKDLFVLLLGPEYQEACKIIPFLMFEPIMYTISETTATGIVVQKKSGYQLIVASVSCVVNFFGNWLLTPIMGPQGAALSTGISYVVFFAIRTLLANKVYYVKYNLPGFAASAVSLMAFSVYASNHSFSPVQVLMFTGVIGIILLSYRSHIPFAVKYAKQFILKILKRKKI